MYSYGSKAVLRTDRLPVFTAAFSRQNPTRELLEDGDAPGDLRNIPLSTSSPRLPTEEGITGEKPEAWKDAIKNAPGQNDSTDPEIRPTPKLLTYVEGAQNESRGLGPLLLLGCSIAEGFVYDVIVWTFTLGKFSEIQTAT